MNAQVSYCAAVGIDMESQESRTYLQGQQAIYFAVKHAAEEILEAKEETEEPNNEQLGLDMKMEIAQLGVKIKEDIKHLTTASSISREMAEGWRHDEEVWPAACHNPNSTSTQLKSWV